MVRIQLELPQEQVDVLDELVKETKLRTRKELFNNALTLFEWAVNEKRFGRGIASVDDAQGVIKELLMPALQAVPVKQPVGRVAALSGSVGGAKGKN